MQTLFLQTRHFVICPLHELWPTDSLLPDLFCHHWASHSSRPQGREGRGREGNMSPLQGTVWLWFESPATIPGPRGALQSHPSLHPCKNTLAFLPQPSFLSDLNRHKCRTLVFLHFYCLWGSKKIFIWFSKQQSSCVSLKFPTWQCAGSWWRLQTKPKLWELWVWSLHLC